METKEQYWTNRYRENNTAWNIGAVSTPIKEYIDQLKNKNLKILIPGAGYGYEASYLLEHGFKYVHLMDISAEPLKAFKQRVPSFPDRNIIHANFFEHEKKYDLILEQTFFCSFKPTPENRMAYAKKMHELLAAHGKLAGVWFNHALDTNGEPPYGGSKVEYESYFNPYFHTQTFEACHNSIKPRMGKELFGIFAKK